MVIPVFADKRAASRISLTIRLISNDDISPLLGTFPAIAAAKYVRESLYGGVNGGA